MQYGKSWNGKRSFKIFQNKKHPDESIIMVDSKIYFVRFSMKGMAMDVYKQASLFYMISKYSYFDFSNLRDI